MWIPADRVEATSTRRTPRGLLEPEAFREGVEARWFLLCLHTREGPKSSFDWHSMIGVVIKVRGCMHG
ncbi:hypothetical protein L798_00289 [Zootermopsis nevadensis]|uniref:Uncharacterized protein n=1 Tax=Zootermopsis nevadensis TaxID=136037 RepID=A0A067RGP6_ZOONE|nr:hypothetical protein L798_00289 [Zootermopsis nevadensis]